MRTRFIFLVPLMLLVVSSSVFAKSKRPKYDGLLKWVKKDVVYFKVSKLFVGGTVSVYDDTGKLLESDKLPHTHTMIYFDEAPEGRYTIKVKKGNMSAEFQLTKIHMDDSSALPKNQYF